MSKSNHGVEYVELPKPGQPVNVYQEFLASLRPRINFFDRSKGYLSWVQGKVLLMARKECKKKGSWKAFLNAIDMQYRTAYQCCMIADLVPEHNAILAKTMTEMLAMVWKSYEPEKNQIAEAYVEGSKNKSKKKRNVRNETVTDENLPNILKAAAKNATRLIDNAMVEPSVSPDEASKIIENAILTAEGIRNDMDRLIIRWKQVLKDKDFSVPFQKAATPAEKKRAA